MQFLSREDDERQIYYHPDSFNLSRIVPGCQQCTGLRTLSVFQARDLTGCADPDFSVDWISDRPGGFLRATAKEKGKAVNMGYCFDEEIAPSDCAFSAWGENLEQLFEQAALAVTETTVELEDVREVERRTFELKQEDLESLLIEWLEELVYVKDVDRMVFRRYEIDIDESQNSLSARLYGETLDNNRHRINNDIKAVTYHKFSLEKSAGGWKAFVILDL